MANQEIVNVIAKRLDKLRRRPCPGWVPETITTNTTVPEPPQATHGIGVCECQGTFQPVVVPRYQAGSRRR